MNRMQYNRISELTDRIMQCCTKTGASNMLDELKFIADNSPEPEGSIIAQLWDDLTRYVTRGSDKESIRSFILSDMMRLRSKIDKLE